MERNNDIVTKLGTRKVQHATNSHILNVPNVAIIALGWKPQDKIDVTMINNEYLIIKKVVG